MDRRQALQLGALTFMAVGAGIFYHRYRDYDVDWKNEVWNIRVAEQETAEPFIRDFSSQLPVLYIQADDIEELMNPDPNVYPRRAEVIGNIYEYNQKLTENDLFHIPNKVYDYARVKLRGRSSSTQPKRPYAIELQDEYGNSVNEEFLGFDKESDFVLHAPYIDKTCLKNYIAFTLASQLFPYVSRVKPVELFINQTDTPVTFEDYKGVYLAIEKIKAGKNRVPIESLVLKDTLEEQLREGGGYIIRRDKFDEGSDTATMLPGLPYYYELQVVYPKEDEITPQAIDMLHQELSVYINALYEGSFEDLERYFDVDGFINMILFVEMIDHGESFTGSTYFYRLPGGKLCPGPPWDYDLSMGTGHSAKGEQSKPRYMDSRLERSFLYHEEFTRRLKLRWKELRAEGGLFSDKNLALVADSCIENIGDAAFDRNAARWPELFDGKTEILTYRTFFTSWQEEVAFMRRYLVGRGAYLDKVYEELDISELPEKE